MPEDPIFEKAKPPDEDRERDEVAQFRATIAEMQRQLENLQVNPVPRPILPFPVAINSETVSQNLGYWRYCWGKCGSRKVKGSHSAARLKLVLEV